MSQISAQDMERIAAYLDGELSPGARAEVERWIAAEEGRWAWVAGLHGAQALLGRADQERLAQADTAAVIAQVTVRIADSQIAMPGAARTARAVAPKHARKWRYSVAASVLVAGVAMLLVFFVRLGQTGESGTPTWYRTAVGQQATVTLADGSIVRLAPQTALAVMSGFGVASRTVSVEGEAVFEVRPRTTLPFFVQTGLVTTHVLGTTFSVRRYADDSHTRVVVMDGKVEMTSPRLRQPAMVLSAGMLGVMSDSTASSMAVGNATTYASWMDGRFVFQRAPVREVLSTMSRWYGYEFQITDSVLIKRHLTVGISAESAEVALKALKAVWDVDFVYRDSVITVYPSRSGSEKVIPRRESYSIPKAEVGR